MRFHREAIKIEEAQRRIMLWAAEGPIEKVSLLQSVGRSLAEDVIASHSVPHFRHSGMDGYAIRSSDSIHASQQNSIELEVVEEVPCGVIPTQQIRQGTASRIMTGASIPDGADAVIMLEMIETIERNGKTYVLIKKELRAGENVADIGVEITEGNALIKKGATIGDGEVAILATFGKSEVTVYKQPTVMIFSTGTELLNLTDPLQPGKIRNSNSYMVAAQVHVAGGIPIVMNHIPDDI
ncbi:MAG: molybdopterin molybdotransferase MoeA, partial [Bacilli bacterium]